MEHISQTIEETMAIIFKMGKPSEGMSHIAIKEILLDMKTVSERDSKLVALQGDGKSFFNFLSLRKAEQTIARQE